MSHRDNQDARASRISLDIQRGFELHDFATTYLDIRQVVSCPSLRRWLMTAASRLSRESEEVLVAAADASGVLCDEVAAGIVTTLSGGGR